MILNCWLKKIQVIRTVEPSSYQTLFDKLAPHYRIIDFLSLGSTSYLRREAVQLANIQGGVVLDLMCGTGNNIQYVEQHPFKKYIGLDASAEMMYHAKAKYLESEKVSFVHCNLIGEIPAGVKGNHIICTYGLKCLVSSEYDRFASTIDELLEPGGTISIHEFRMPRNKVFRFFTSLYVNFFCGLICLVVTGSLAPTRSLVQSMNPPIDPLKMKVMLENRHFDVVIREKWLATAVFVYGKKRVE
jgi:demethylmenaquinone methyltransferase / 2-methoxy-6-polyprenyl-1,4-benzoquinol methylase